MANDVKRYWLESFIDGFYKARQFVLATDHGRIVAGLQTQVEHLMVENECFAKNLRGKSATTGATYSHLIAERDQLAARCRELEDQRAMWVANATELGNQCDAMRTEVERREKQRIVLCEDKDKLIGMCQERDRQIEGLRAEVERLKEDQQRRDHENANLLRDAWGEVDTLRASLAAIAEWPDGGNNYGQERIKKFAASILQDMQ